MNIIRNLNELNAPLNAPVLTIGNFDGVHKGHLALFDRVKERARAIGGSGVVLTFDPHPMTLMLPQNAPLMITPIPQKLRLIEAAGLDAILCIPFDRAFSVISARDFVTDILLDKIGIKELVVGYDYSFGHRREGDISLLKEMGEQYGFTVHVLGQITIDDVTVSSTSIRRMVQSADLEGARKLLGRDYQICGTVIAGKNRGGRLLGFPTANLKLIDELIPKRGVYAVRVLIDDQCYDGLTNIGYNPTFEDRQLSVETHILDFSEDIVGKTIRVNFIQRLRDEETFDSVEALADMIRRDVERTRALFGKTGPCARQDK
ncbi:MAG: bifunctional riboflavin kinase/FAD synthetase [Deltaproteobacteria bacterium]|nr:bifunctional riboflavin kinase/FAD synthetase [Deltaproteobacteria bacterium]MBW1818846.1 bifunctional riboflavin kinase/FAD synthetase [Deltaproteobacteria bacterium]